MARKRKRSSTANKGTTDECSCLKDALVLIEKRGTIETLDEAQNLLRRVEPFRVAKVLLASKVSTKFFAEPLTNEIEALLEVESKAQVWKELEDLREYPCCRGPASGKDLPSSRIVSVIAPLMRRKRLPKKMSAYSPAIEIMLQFTEVVVDKDEKARSEWEEVNDWIDSKMAALPLLTKILDPVYLLVRGNNGAAGPPRGTIETALMMGVVGRDAGGFSVAPTAATMEVVRPGAVGYNCIPDLYRFPDKEDAQVARVCLLYWAAQQVPVVQFDIVRLSITMAGFQWL